MDTPLKSRKIFQQQYGVATLQCESLQNSPCSTRLVQHHENGVPTHYTHVEAVMSYQQSAPWFLCQYRHDNGSTVWSRPAQHNTAG